MAWATPAEFAVGTVLTAAEMNVISSDLKFLASSTSGFTAATVVTTSTSFVTLTGGPAVTVTTGAHAIVMVSAAMATVGVAIARMGFKVSGATTLAASTTTAAVWRGLDGTTGVVSPAKISRVTLTAGSNTFTAQYEGGGTDCYFSSRSLVVIPLP